MPETITPTDNPNQKLEDVKNSILDAFFNAVGICFCSLFLIFRGIFSGLLGIIMGLIFLYFILGFIGVVVSHGLSLMGHAFLGH